MKRSVRLWLTAGGIGVVGTVILILAGVSVGVSISIAFSAIAAWGTIYSINLTHESNEHTEKQLELALRQVENVPRLDVEGLSMVRATDDEKLRETKRTIKEAKRRESSRPDYMPITTYEAEYAYYEGHHPAFVLDLTVKNTGQVAANDIGGTVSFSSNNLRMMYYPDLDIEEVEEKEDGWQHAETSTFMQLMPGQTLTYRIATWYFRHSEAAKNSTDFVLRYDLLTPQGQTCRGELTQDDLERPQ